MKAKKLSEDFYITVILIGFSLDYILYKTDGYLPLGIVSILYFFACLYFHFRHNMYRHVTIIPSEINQEELIVYGPAFYFEKTITLKEKGWLYLTPTHLLFYNDSLAEKKNSIKANAKNSQKNMIFKFSLMELVSYSNDEKYSDVLVLGTEAGNYKFQVFKINEWKRSISALK